MSTTSSATSPSSASLETTGSCALKQSPSSSSHSQQLSYFDIRPTAPATFHHHSRHSSATQPGSTGTTASNTLVGLGFSMSQADLHVACDPASQLSGPTHNEGIEPDIDIPVRMPQVIPPTPTELRASCPHSPGEYCWESLVFSSSPLPPSFSLRQANTSEAPDRNCAVSTDGSDGLGRAPRLPYIDRFSSDSLYH